MAHTNTLEKKRKRRLQKQLTAYSVAASAALALANPADASIITYNGPALPVDSNTPQAIDIDGSGTTDFNFLVKTLGSVPVMHMSGSGYHPGVAVIGTFPFAQNLPSGAQISIYNPNQTFFSIAALQGVVWTQQQLIPPYIFGPFAGSTGFIGIAFAITNPLTQALEPHTGWIEYQGDANSLSGTILGWAYESTPGAPINAGAVPLPGTLGLGLLALGAAGVARLRQRKKEGNEETV